MSTMPARVFNLAGGTLAPGSPADLVIADSKAPWVVDPAAFYSKSRNTPFAGRRLIGRAEVTIVRGEMVYQRVGDPAESRSEVAEKAPGKRRKN